MKRDSFTQMLIETLLEREHTGSMRQLNLCRHDGVYLWYEGRRYLSFASNDYLGIATDPGNLPYQERLKGAGASRLVSGNHTAYEEAETLLANIKGTEAALIFGSGYLANIGTIPAITRKGDLVLMDRLSHACMLDGVRLSGAQFMRFRHNDTEHLEELLNRKRDKFRHCLILTETIFSMDGNRAPLEEIRVIADKYNAWLMTDDAHGFGLPVPYSNPADVQMGTFSKAAGMIGGYVCGSRLLCDMLVNHARSLIFSTALPEAVVQAISRSLRVLQAEPERAERVMGHARRVTDALGLPVPQSPIIPVITGSNESALKAQTILREKGLWIPAIRPPTVPEGTARLRISLSAAHNDEHITQLIDAVSLVRSSG